jgi:tetratricopeptide (TPR) repeat protein
MTMKTLCIALFAGLLALPLAAEEAKPTAAELVQQGDTHFEAGRMEAAEQAYRAAMELKDDTAALRLGGFYLAQNRNSDAIQAFKDAIGFNPNNGKAFAALGIAYWHQGNKELAKSALEEALRLDPKLEQVKKLLANWGTQVAPAATH